MPFWPKISVGLGQNGGEAALKLKVRPGVKLWRLVLARTAPHMPGYVSQNKGHKNKR